MPLVYVPHGAAINLLEFWLHELRVGWVEGCNRPASGAHPLSSAFLFTQNYVIVLFMHLDTTGEKPQVVLTRNEEILLRAQSPLSLEEFEKCSTETLLELKRQLIHLEGAQKTIDMWGGDKRGLWVIESRVAALTQVMLEQIIPTENDIKGWEILQMYESQFQEPQAPKVKSKQ